jgi:hypothetical protein
MGLPRLPVYVENDDAADELIRDDMVVEYLAALCLQGRDLARTNNPSEDERPYMFAGVEAGEGEDPVGFIAYDSAIWHIIEFGSRNNPPYAPLRRAAEALGIPLGSE